MAKIVTLKNPDGETIYPLTLADAIVGSVTSTATSYDLSFANRSTYDIALRVVSTSSTNGALLLGSNTTHTVNAVRIESGGDLTTADDAQESFRTTYSDYRLVPQCSGAGISTGSVVTFIKLRITRYPSSINNFSIFSESVSNKSRILWGSVKCFGTFSGDTLNLYPTRVNGSVTSVRWYINGTLI